MILKFISALVFFASLYACKKSKPADPDPSTPTNPTNPTNPINPPNSVNPDPTVGFFLDDWEPKTFTAPSYQDASLPSANATVTVTVDASNVLAKIPKAIFGQNANSWMSQMVTEAPLMNHLNNLKPSMIRFPGGSISDIYFWNGVQGQKPADAPDTMLDANGSKTAADYWYGKNNSSWTISLDNYYNLLQQTGSQGMITVNYGYARYGKGANPVSQAAHLAADWVRYDNGRTKYWEIGNECNGTWEAGYRINTATNQDSQPAVITGALYGQHVKVFVDSMKKAAQEIGKTIQVGAYVLEKLPEAWQTPADQTWNNGVFSQSGNKADYYSIHSYYTAYQTNAGATEILNTATANTSAMMNYVKSSMSNNGATVKPIALTEWNITSQGSMQQVSFVNGMHATILLAEAIKNKYGQTSRWDLANGWSNGNDHGLFNNGDEPGVSKWNPRPAFYYMYYMQKMLGDRLVSTTTTSGDVLAYGTLFTSGAKGIVMINKSATAQTASIVIQNTAALARVWWYSLTGGTDNGEFSRKVLVNGSGPSEASGGPSDYKTLKAYSAAATSGVKVSLPARSVIFLAVE